MQPIIKMWYDYLDEGKLMGLKCKRCGTVHFPPFPICRDCSGVEMEWVEVSGYATVNEIALVTAPDEWFTEYAPYYYAYADTEEGSSFSSMLMGLEAEPEEVLDKYVRRFPLQARIEIQKRDGYSYPVYRLEE